ncbi:site-specific DNA-methyltransferase [Gardnerella vaginalis]|jgi:hypothetical protein|uniref:site-specific DNA-methyltransferase n=1 Tax=Gardnerella vaginalis TaxID=2702 RepID=UPI00200F767C|nr:site-specific DNA-methyltransferase [Gardnerella vaginalis]UQA85082.1 site-specific DNA-methyltransferase [Gardnerella vaginalis]
MANLSQKKRERMLAFLNKVKEEHKDDDETLIALDEIENELNSKKYGLVWEKHEEEVDRMMQDNIPVFTEVKEREIKATDENSYNFLLEGDNLHSLKLLEKTHAGKIDVIYIDPPYNTGNQDFIYDDAFIDKNDGYSHSKWLSFMSERLEIAKQLLSDEGVIFISIDDNEQAQLKLLCDSIFGEENFLTQFIVENNPKGRKNSNYSSITSEYCLAYSKNSLLAHFVENIPKQSSSMRLDDEGNYVHASGRRVIIGENKFNKLVSNFSSDKHFTLYFRKSDRAYKVIKEYNVSDINSELIQEGFKRYISYRGNAFVENTYTYQKMEELMANKALDFTDDKIYEKNFRNLIRIKNIITNQKYTAIINNKEVDYEIDVKTTSAKQNLAKIFNGSTPFDFPKNIGLIKLLLTLIYNKSATILDFFAGSGTTAHAVLELNNEDGGNRKFILCTNNENNICEEVTYERIKRVIHGYANVEGIPANLKYFKTDFIPKDADDVSAELLSHIKEMVELENGITLDNKHYLIVLSDEQADELAKNWSNYEDVKAIYVSRNVLFTSEQDALFSNTEIHIIPDYYFEYELKEVGETW